MISWELAARYLRDYRTRGMHNHATAIRTVMVAALSRRERHAYEIIRSYPWISTADIGLHVGISNAHAGVITDRLYQTHLVRFKQAQNLIKTWHVT